MKCLVNLRYVEKFFWKFSSFLTFSLFSSFSQIVYDDQDIKQYDVYSRLGIKLLPANSAFPENSEFDTFEKVQQFYYDSQARHSRTRRGRNNPYGTSRAFPRHPTSSDEDDNGAITYSSTTAYNV